MVWEHGGNVIEKACATYMQLRAVVLAPYMLLCRSLIDIEHQACEL